MRGMKLNIKIITRVVATVAAVLFFNNYLIYYIVLFQCSWPMLNQSVMNSDSIGSTATPMYAMVIADTHLLGSKKGHWLDKLQREWQMYRAFQTSMVLHRPNVVFVLGDLFDEGQWCGADEFSSYVDRFHKLFAVPEGTQMHVVAGNHDIGFHYWISPYLQRRFSVAFDLPLVQYLNIYNNTVVLINSMAMEGDRCSFCSLAERQLKGIAAKLQCMRGIGNSCKVEINQPYSRPIVLQHFPLYRPSDALCNEPDEAPEDIKHLKFREKWECLSQEATGKILDLLNPRLVLGGHTHHGCYRLHKDDIHEYSIASFSWRNKPIPSFALITVTPHEFGVSKCYLPNERTVLTIYVLAGFALLVWILYPLFRHKFRHVQFRKIYYNTRRKVDAFRYQH